MRVYRNLKRIICIAMYIGILFAAGYGEQLSRYVVLVIVDGARYSETLGDRTARYIPE
jgi:hypothetical protein